LPYVCKCISCIRDISERPLIEVYFYLYKGKQREILMKNTSLRKMDSIVLFKITQGVLYDNQR
jgi:hypothetical protein